MAQVPSMPGARVVKALQRAGFTVARISGSHHIMRHADGRGTTVPVHGSREVAKGTLRSILKDIGLSADDLIRLDKGRGGARSQDQLAIIDPRDGVVPAHLATHRSGAAAEQPRHTPHRTTRTPHHER